MKLKNTLLAICAALGFAQGAFAQEQQTRLEVVIENLSPNQGTFQTPFWVGLHDGTFDTYDRNVPASTLPQAGSVAMERLAEDGNTEPLTQDFAQLAPTGQDATVASPSGPISPGTTVVQSFLVDPSSEATRFFSYASMVIPSNDFFVANGNPQAHQIFDENGVLVAQPFFVTGSQVLDAGTEVNDEIPDNTAFFGQAAPNTGTDENGNVIGVPQGLTGFAALGSGGILDDPRFAAADFLQTGYPVARISFRTAPAVLDDATFSGRFSGDQEVPAVDTNARGLATYELTENGSVINFTNVIRRLRGGADQITMAHLHLGPAGQNGPVVAALFTPDTRAENVSQSRRGRRLPNGRRARVVDINGSISSQDLVGPLQGQPLDSLATQLAAGNIYVNIHTESNPAGEIRAQLAAQ